MTVLQIKIPPTNEKKEGAMEEVLASLHRVLPNNTNISFEMVSIDQFLHFYIVVKNEFENVIESQIYAQYPDAEIEESEDYLLNFGTNISFAQIDFKHSSVNPIKTYHFLQEDFLKSLSAIFSKTNSYDKVSIQFCIKRIGSNVLDRGVVATQAKLFKKGNKEDENSAIYKLSKDLFKGKLRLAYSAQDKNTAKQNINTIVGLLKTVKGVRNELKLRKFFVSGSLGNQFKERKFTKGDFWTAAEIATIYHFPYQGIMANIVNTHSKKAPAPDILPREGLVNPQDVSFIGETNYRNERKKFGIKRIDRRRHVYIVGKTGSGKSKLLELLLKSDIENNKGCCLIDPHGDLAEAVLKFVPKERIKDVVYIDPSDKNFPIGFNPLEPIDDFEAKQHLSTFFIAIFKKLLVANWNPRMEHLIRYITLALLETPDSSILGIARILSDTAYRQRVIRQIQDPVVKAFWTTEFTPSDAQFANEAMIPILNKIGQFVSNPVIRNIVGQRKNVLHFDEFMNSGKIVLINLSKGKLGDENTALLGSMFITKIQQAALARAQIPENERRDFYFYIDEFQNFATEAFSSILSEARKYHLDLTIAHQYIAQLPEDVRATAFGNVGTILVFAVGGEDASVLEKEFAPIITADDMIGLNTREMYIKMSIDGKVTPPFSGTTLNVPSPKQDFSQEIIDHSRLVYAQNKTKVENDIAQWTQNANLQESFSGEDSFPEPIV